MARLRASARIVGAANGASRYASFAHMLGLSVAAPGIGAVSGWGQRASGQWRASSGASILQVGWVG